MKKNKNVVKYRKPLNINIGVVVFIIIFIYLVFNAFTYLTEVHISPYEVEQGTIAVNNVYNGLALRSEKVCTSDYSGSVNYYVKEGSKIAYGDLLYSVDESGNVASMINAANQDGTKIDADNLAEIEDTIEDFQYAYQSGDFYQVYSFKDNVNASLNEALSMNALNSISDYVATAEENNTFHKVYATEPGIITYYVDGYENVSTENFTSDMFDESNYTRQDLKAEPSTSSGGQVYKLIDSELWNIILPIPEESATALAADNTIRIRFLKDSKETYATYTITNQGGQNYLILSLKNGMVRYASERYVEVELLLSEETGLKIPNSAITEKAFFTIPVDYFIKGGDSDSTGILVDHADKDGNHSSTFVSPTIYYATDDFYYIDSESVSAGDVLVKTDSKDTYVVGSQTASLQGVYNINKGYAVFKQIDILYQNEEYSIVKTGTTFGIMQYDHIALDGGKITENQLIKQ